MSGPQVWRQRSMKSQCACSESRCGPRIANSGLHFQFDQEYKQNFDSLYSSVITDLPGASGFLPVHGHNADTSVMSLGPMVIGARLRQRALAIREKVLGPQHPDTAAILNDLAFLLREQGDLAGPRSLYERALAIRESVLGPEHHDTAASLINLVTLLDALGRGEEAAALRTR